MKNKKIITTLMAAAFFCISLFAYDAVRADVEDCYMCYTNPGPECATVNISGYTGCSTWHEWGQWQCTNFGTICGGSPCENPMDPCEG